MENQKTEINFKKFFLNIILPTFLSIFLFIVLIFWYIIPYFEYNLLNSKKEMIRELVNTTISIANKNYNEYKSGQISEELAKSDAINKIKCLRYGIELKDYFFITDMNPVMIMHPYRSDLDGTDLKDLKDPEGKALFVEMVKEVKHSGNGYVDYMWQWMDDSSRIVPKISYVSEFKPWGWVIGTGIYIEDVREKIAEIERELILVSIAISGIIAILLIVIVFQNFKTEKKRSIAEKALIESKEKYKTLVEASTEGTAMILGEELLYSNAIFDQLFGETQIFSFSRNLSEIFPSENVDAVNTINKFLVSNSSYIQFETIVGKENSTPVLVLLSLSKIRLNDKDGLIITIKDLKGESLFVIEQYKWSRIFVNLMDIIGISMFRLSIRDNGRFSDFNENTIDLLSYNSRNELSKVRFKDILEDSTSYFYLLNHIREFGYISDYRIRVRTFDKRLITLQINAGFDKDENSGEEFLVGIFADITLKAKEEIQKEQSYKELQTVLLQMNSKIKNYQKETISCKATLSVSQALELMIRYNTSLLLLRTNEGIPLGVVTDKDVRLRIIENHNNQDKMICDFMSSPIIGLQDTATLTDAMIIMDNKNIHHLIIRNNSNEVTGYISSDELLQKLLSISYLLISSIEKSNTLVELKNIYNRQKYFVTSLINSGGNSEYIIGTIASVADNISRKLAELIFLELGEAPVAFAFVSLGSEGRGEQTLISDQDNALIYDDSSSDRINEASIYFARFAERMNYMLDAVGYPYCSGGVMANNPKWNQPLSKWKNYFEDWITNPEPENLLDVAVFFDMKLTFGDKELLTELQKYIYQVLNENIGFFGFLARVCSKFKTQLSIFGRIQTESTEEHSKIINIKNPIRVIVHLVRLYSMKYKVLETNTTKRIKSLYELNAFSESLSKELLFSYDFLTQLQLKSQITTDIDNSKHLNYIDISTLTSMEVNLIKNVFSLLVTFQSKVKFDFGLND